jgi:hypothetical protein
MTKGQLGGVSVGPSRIQSLFTFPDPGHRGRAGPWFRSGGAAYVVLGLLIETRGQTHWLKSDSFGANRRT